MFKYIKRLQGKAFILFVTVFLISNALAGEEVKSGQSKQKHQPYASSANPKVAPAFIAFSPGSVKPEGWLHDWARTAADGITGHLDERAAVYAEGYKGTSFKALGVGPNGTGWPLEQCAYWLDGLVRLAYILDDEVLIKKAQSRLDLVVDGVLEGGESFVYWQPKDILDGAFNNWAHSHMGRALVAYYKATGDERILEALVKVYTEYPLPEFQATFFNVNGMVNVDPMLETYRLSGNKKILDNALASIQRPIFKKVIDEWHSKNITPGHAVIFYEDIRVPAMLYLWTGDSKLLETSLNALEWNDENYLLPMGLCSSEEYHAGIGSTRNVETCNVGAGSWTYHWMLRITGQGRFADRMERIFFNAGPAPISRDFQTMSYYQSPNRLNLSVPDAKDEPSHPGPGCYEFSQIGNSVLCCVGYCNRILPTYIANMWMATEDDGLVATLYGPCSVQSTVAGGVPVTVDCVTNYPFDTKIEMTVKPEKQTSFPLYLRVPQWCDEFKVRVNGRKVSVKVDELGFVKLSRKWKFGDEVTIALPMKPRMIRGRETAFPDVIGYYKAGNNRKLAALDEVDNPWASVLYGPLLMALPIQDVNANLPAEGTRWNYALDIAPGKLVNDVDVIRNPMPKHWHWQLDNAPVQLELSGREFDWKPTELQPLPKEPIEGGKSARITLVPYGCTKFRVSMFPVTESTWKGMDN